MVNNASIDWLFPWPDQALLAVATELIKDDNPLIPADYRQAIIEHHVDVHKSVLEVSRDFVTTLRRQNYVTPRNFLDFISTYEVQTYLLTYLFLYLLTCLLTRSQAVLTATLCVLVHRVL